MDADKVGHRQSLEGMYAAVKVWQQGGCVGRQSIGRGGNERVPQCAARAARQGREPTNQINQINPACQT